MSSLALPPAAASMLAFLSAIGVARAQDLCADIRSLIEQSHTQFAAIAGAATDETGARDVTLSLAGASYCRVTSRAKRSAYHCAWEFPYRAAQAYDTFDELVRALGECIGGRAALHSDRSVNHPDYYALRRYQTAQAAVSVSVKDKGALGSTFVFVRVEGGSSR